LPGSSGSRLRPGAKWLLPVAGALLAMAGWTVLRDGSGSAQTLSGEGYQVVARYPHDPDAYTQGLFFDGGHLIEGTGLRGESTLRRVEIETGRVIESIAIPTRYFGEGIAAIGDRIFQLTWTSGLGFIYDRETFQQTGQFRYRGEGWGLATDGEVLILSDGTAQLRFLDPNTFEERRSVEVRRGASPVTNLNELEFINGEVWANVWYSNQILRISPETGEVIGELDMTPLRTEARPRTSEAVLNGIAYDPDQDHVYITGKLWPTMFVLRVDATR
jgi:glutamine cyclotransferase